jgi:hypothetical protein
MKARAGKLMAPVNTFLNDIVDMLPDQNTCDVDAYVNCWMKEPSWKRREMVQQDMLDGIGIWDFLPAYSASSPCASESGCARPVGSDANGDLDVQRRAFG